MPIYEYACTACGHKTDILHGINEPGPHFCPECGAEGTMRKGFAPPAIVFKGSGWAKKDRASGSSTTVSRKAGESSDSSTSESKAADSKSTSSESGSGSPASAGTGGGTD